MNPDFSAGDASPETFAARAAAKIESLGLSPKKTLEFLLMFVVLGIIVYFDLMRGYQAARCSQVQASSLPLIFLKYFIFYCWPFGLMAAWDSAWTEKNAGNVFLLAYIAATAVWYYHTRCGFCIWAGFIRMMPFAVGGMIAHRIGTWSHRFRAQK